MYKVDTHSVSDERAPSSWSALTSSIHCAMDLEFADPNNFRGRLEQQGTESFQLVQWWSGGVRFDRSRRHIAHDERGTVELFVPMTGSAIVEYGSSREVVHPRDLALYPIDRPLRLLHESGFSAVTFIIPALRAETRGADLAKVHLFDGDQGVGRIVRDMVSGLRAGKDTLQAGSFDAVSDRLVDLLCLLATSAADTGTGATHKADIEASIRRFIRDNAPETDLSLQSIAAALGWSTRYVQAIMHDAGTTPTALIRQERLALARQRLESPTYASWMIERIGRSCGFQTASAFSSAFRAEFGMTPSEARFR
jgi:AraC-like DNA-binding protein